MIELSLAEFADAVSGKLVVGDPNLRVSGTVDTDSRKLTAGGIFFAKLGAHENGHRYLPDLDRRGISLAIVSEPNLELSIAQILVPDTVSALAKLAEFVLNRVRERGALKVIGITGSNGKTSTRAMLQAALERQGKTIAPVDSYNNEVGLPLTVLKLQLDSEFLILEDGAAGVGSIERLARWSRPDIGVQLKVGMAHAGEFGGIEVTAQIKAELMEFIGSAAVLNYDDPRVRDFAYFGKRLGFGFADDAHVRLISSQISLTGTEVELAVAGARYSTQLKILGEHQAMNVAATIAVIDELGLDVSDALAAVSGLEMAERWRMQLLEAPEGYAVINDAYNASPDSMRAALQTLATLGRQGHRTVAILGEMAELGEYSSQEHDAIGRLVVRLNIDQLFVVGANAKLIHMGATQEGSWDGESQFIDSINGAFETIRAKLMPGDVVLVKASNIAGLRFLGDELAGVA